MTIGISICVVVFVLVTAPAVVLGLVVAWGGDEGTFDRAADDVERFVAGTWEARAALAGPEPDVDRFKDLKYQARRQLWRPPAAPAGGGPPPRARLQV